MQRDILLLEDDIQLNDTIKQFLEYYNYRVFPAYDAYSAKDILYENSIDLMLLDIKIPHQNGFDFLKELRDNGVITPAIFITSLNSVDDVTRGFRVGCDDYIRKPFALKELKVRVDAIIKRAFNSKDEVIELENSFSFDIKNLILKRDNIEINLKAKELKLLTLFLKKPNELLTYNEIFNTLWDYNETPSYGSLRAYINRIRNILGRDRIKTQKHIGYRYVR